MKLLNVYKGKLYLAVTYTPKDIIFPRVFETKPFTSMISSLYVNRVKIGETL